MFITPKESIRKSIEECAQIAWRADTSFPGMTNL
jgi:hypothetical protein